MWHTSAARIRTFCWIKNLQFYEGLVLIEWTPSTWFRLEGVHSLKTSSLYLQAVFISSGVQYTAHICSTNPSDWDVLGHGSNEADILLQA